MYTEWQSRAEKRMRERDPKLRKNSKKRSLMPVLIKKKIFAIVVEILPYVCAIKPDLYLQKFKKRDAFSIDFFSATKKDFFFNNKFFLCCYVFDI